MAPGPRCCSTRDFALCRSLVMAAEYGQPHSLSTCEYNVEEFMKARFATGAETRLRMIRTAADLFHKQGARTTSPDEIIEASRTGKGQFYHYFRSKEGLIHEVLQTHLDEIKAGVSRVNYEINSWKDLQKWFASQVGIAKRL
jgi:hypothetical protein